MARFAQLTNDEKTATGGFTHRFDFSVADIPTGIANNTAQSFAAAGTPAGFPGLPLLKAGDIVKRCLLYLTTCLKSSGDAAFNSTTIDVGDAGSATRFISGVQINENGTEVITTFPGTENTIYTGNSQVQINLNSMAAKSLSNLNVGQFYILFAIERAADKATTKAAPFGAGYT